MNLVQTLLFFALVLLASALAVNLLSGLLDTAEGRVLAYSDAAVTLSEATGDHASALAAGQFVAEKLFWLAIAKLCAITIAYGLSATLLYLLVARCV